MIEIQRDSCSRKRLTDETILLKKDILTNKRNFHKKKRLFQICLFIYFYEKILSVNKHS